MRNDLIEFVQAILLAKLSDLSRKEIEAMLQLNDIRKSRVFQEAEEEGKLEGIELGIAKRIEKGIEIAGLAAHNITAEDIADILGRDIDLVRRHLSNGQANGASHG